MYHHHHHEHPVKQPQRRRNRRHQQRLRTVEVTRGRSGYGFTISGQSPCILSCIVAGSPADHCGLKTGDYLISVNGQLISESPHDDVVRLIGSSRGLLVLQIAENYNSSDSSEDEFQVRPKVSSRVKLRSRAYERSVDDMDVAPRPNRAHMAKLTRDRSVDYPRGNVHRAMSPTKNHGSNGIENIHPMHKPSFSRSVQDGVIRYKTSSQTKHTIITREARLGMAKSQSHPEGFNRPLPPTPLSEMSNGLQVNSEPRSRVKRSPESFQAWLSDKAVVGYAGSIEMPRDLTIARVQAVRGAVRRLRMEQKVHALVLMRFESASMKLVNHLSCTVAAYPPEKLAFAGVCPEDQRFFGVVTLHTTDEREHYEILSSSCHVFFVNSSLALHHLHASQIDNFSLQCTMDHHTQTCAEFPACAKSVVHAISSRYHCPHRSRYTAEMEQVGCFLPVGEPAFEASQPTQAVASKVCVVDLDDPNNSINSSAISSLSQLDQSSILSKPDESERKHPPPARPALKSEQPSPLELQNSATNLRRHLQRYMTNQDMTPRLSAQALPPRDSHAHVHTASQLNMPPVSMSTPVDRPSVSKPPPAPQKESVMKERSKSTPPTMAPGSRPIDPPQSNMTDDLKNQLQPQLSIKKTSAENLSTWRSTDNEVASGSATARPADDEEKSVVAGWAVSFDRLLQDPAGLAKFTEYLKKEYSEENIKFWKKCEDYSQVENEAKRAALGKEIFQLHLSSMADEAVNVDSHSRAQAELALQKGSAPHVFEATQKQIFQLMKQDSYPRFLKSDIYKQCVIAELEHEPLPASSDNAKQDKLQVPQEVASDKKNMKKTKSSAETGEEKRRRSLLPWIRNKEKKLNKAVTESSLHKQTSDAMHAVKVLLPDGVMTSMEVKGHQWTDALRAHCEALGLLYEFLIITDEHSEVMSIHAETCLPLIHLHKAVVFKLEMPSHKCVGVKCLPEKSLRQVLSPVMATYGHAIDSSTVIHVSGTGVILEETAEIGNFDGKHLVVQSLDDFKEWGGGTQRGSAAKPPLPKGKAKEKSLGSLFKDIGSVAFDEHGVWDPDLKHSKSGDKNAGFFDFIRRNSIGDDSKSTRTRKASAHGSQKALNQQKPVSASKKKPPPQHNLPESTKKKALNDDEERFLNLLSRTSKQMDDQRGLTPKDLELPDFLKVEKPDSPKKSTLQKSSLHHSDSSIHKSLSCETPTQQISCSNDALDSSFAYSDRSFSSSGAVPDHEQAERYFSQMSTTGLLDSQGSFADYLNLTATERMHSDDDCDITLIPPSSSSSSSRANSPPPSSQGSWQRVPCSSEDDGVHGDRSLSTPSPTTHSLILDPNDGHISFV